MPHPHPSPGRFRLPALALAAAVALGALAHPARLAAAPGKGPDTVADVAEKVMDAVVNISTAQNVAPSRQVPAPQAPPGSPYEDFFDELFKRRQDDGAESRSRRVSSLGSGFVIDPSGLIVTNNHVIADADEIFANFNDGSKLKAELIGRDTKTDIALLKVNPPKPLTAVKFGDSEKLRVGDWVMAIGNPFGLGGTLTVGVVSARNRDINSGPYDNFIQTDAAINRGNSGGPLFNMAGQVIGVNTAIVSPSGGSVGVGFSVPSDLASGVVNQLLQFGETHRGWLGVRYGTVTQDIAQRNGLATPTGAVVSGVTEGGPAARAGLRPGDLIVSYDGKGVTEGRYLQRFVADTPIGKNVRVEYLRGGKRQVASVTIQRLDERQQVASRTPEAPGSVEPPPGGGSRAVTGRVMGMTLAELTSDMRKRFAIDPAVRGLVVTSVDAGSDASGKVQAGDVVIEMGFEPVETIGEAQALAMQAERANGRALLLYISRDGDMTFRSVRPRKG